jgi:hypothetical protein
MLAKWPPLKLAQLAFAGSLLSMSRILAPLLAIIPFALHRWTAGPRQADRLCLNFLIALLPALAGIALLGLAKRRITEGVVKELWTRQQIEPVVEWLRSPFVKRGWWVALAAMCCSYFLLFLLPRNLPDLPTLTANLITISVILLPGPRASLDQIRKALSPEPPRPWSRTLDMKRLEFEQWGAHDVSSAGRSEA